MTRFTTIPASIVAYLLLQLHPAFAQDYPSLAGALTTVHEATVGEFGFYGSTAAIQFGDGTRWTGATGLTGPDTASQGGRDLVVEDRFHIGSQTKTYTGTVVLQFVDDGIVGLDDTLEHWYGLEPEVTDALSVMPQSLREVVTIRDLLSMRTGIAEYLAGQDPNNPEQTVLDVWNANNGDYDLTRQQLLSVSLGLPSTMTPGEQSTFEYSNANFMLAGIIAEAASCQAGDCRDIGQLITEEVVEPLNLTNTLYPVGTEWGTDQHTNGTWVQNELVSDFTETTPSVPNSAGAMISNVEDQLSWLVELTTNTQGTLSPETFAERLENTTEMVGMVGTVEGAYGLGIYGEHSVETGALMLGHGGELSGYQTLMFYYPGDDETAEDDIFVVANVNTFLNVSLDRAFLPSDINSIYFDLQKTVEVFRAYQANPDGCTADTNGTTCTGTTVTTSTLTITDALTVQSSGQRWSEPDIGFDAPVPTYMFYGNDDVGVEAVDAAITVDLDGILEGYGNNLTLLRLDGSANTVEVFGTLEASGAAAVALDASAASDDTITVNRLGTVIGDILATGGNDVLRMDGLITGDVTLGSDAVMDGVGTVMGLVAGAGTVAPGRSNGTVAGSMTASRFEQTDGVLQIAVFGTAGTASLLEIDEQTSNGFPVPDTGVGILNGTILRLNGTSLRGDFQIPILTATNELYGTFAQIEDVEGLLSPALGRLERDLIYADNSVLLTSTSPAAFDAVSAANYSNSLSLLDQSLSLSQSITEMTHSQPQGFAYAVGSYASFEGEDEVEGFSIVASGLVGGIIVPFQTEGQLALSVAQSKTKASIGSGGGTQEIDTFSTGLSFGSKVGALDVGASVFYSEADVDYRRETGAGAARGQTDQQSWSAVIAVGQTQEGDLWRSGWRSSLAYFHVSEDSFTESYSPGVAIRFDERQYERLRIGLDVKAERQPRNQPFAPWVSAGVFYHVDMKNADIDYSAAGTQGTLEARLADGFELQIAAGASYETASGAVWSAGITASGGDLNTTARLSTGFNIKF